MKRIEVEKKYTVDAWEAIDGTRFDKKEECEKYESSASGVLVCKLISSILLCEIPSSNEIFSGDENIYVTLLPKCKEHIDTLNQLYYMFEGRNDSKLLFDEKDINYPVIMGRREYSGTLDWVWFYKLKDIVDEITNEKFTIKSTW